MIVGFFIVFERTCQQASSVKQTLPQCNAHDDHFVNSGESQGRGSLLGFRLWGRTESDMTEATQQQQQQQQDTVQTNC